MGQCGELQSCIQEKALEGIKGGSVVPRAEVGGSVFQGCQSVQGLRATQEGSADFVNLSYLEGFKLYKGQVFLVIPNFDVNILDPFTVLRQDEVSQKEVEDAQETIVDGA
uniref:Uncharacterized protein n=1 Tax=Nelumbo nucifera TaxID=4432 RepID=A0A822Z134_NELNU|nr:TPA_asm: hypothetical protein HUJ06_013024 [Nelumbo nucifera]